MKPGTFLRSALLCAGLTGCAVLHHAQLSDIDNNPNFALKRFDLKVSELGFDHRGAANAARFSGGRDAKNLGIISDIISLFQMGPSTGRRVYVGDVYGDVLLEKIYETCPSGRVTGLTMIREMRRYPVISGEIVKITGYCLEDKAGPASGDKKDQK